MGIVITLAIGIVYFACLSITRTLGKTNEIDPLLGAWSANILFLIISVTLLWRAKE